MWWCVKLLFKVSWGHPTEWSASLMKILPLCASVCHLSAACLGLRGWFLTLEGLEDVFLFLMGTAISSLLLPTITRTLKSMQFQTFLLPKPQRCGVGKEGTQRPGIARPQGHYCEPCLLPMTNCLFSLRLQCQQIYLEINQKCFVSCDTNKDVLKEYRRKLERHIWKDNWKYVFQVFFLLTTKHYEQNHRRFET